MAVAAGGLQGRPVYGRRSHPSRKDAALWDRKTLASSLAHTTHSSPVLLRRPPLPGELGNQCGPPPTTTLLLCARPNNRALPVLLDFIGIFLV